MNDFQLEHQEGKLFAIVSIQGKQFKMDVTKYFEEDNPHDDWLDYRIFGKIEYSPSNE